MSRRKKEPKPIGPNGPLIHPETGEKAPEGYYWARNILSGVYVLERIGTPFTCSVSSETYWCS